MKDLKEFTMVKKGTRQYEHIKNDVFACYSDLWDCYNSYSHSKAKALIYCENLCNNYNGYANGIYSYNSMQFSYTFKFKLDGKEYKAYITKTYNYLIEL